MRETIAIRGAREHNLKNIDLDIPRNRLVVITGVSGSGKSTLAFDTLYAEGQRRYVESLSAYARQFLEQMDKPDVDTIEGLSPAISIEQKTTSKNPRSTVATVTEIYDYLRLLFASIGQAFCPDCGIPIQGQTTEQMADRILALPAGTPFSAPRPPRREPQGRAPEALRPDGPRRGSCGLASTARWSTRPALPSSTRSASTPSRSVIDRLEVRRGPRQPPAPTRSRPRSRSATAWSGSRPRRVRSSSSPRATPARTAAFALAELSPRLFSFNSPQGACPTARASASSRRSTPTSSSPTPSAPSRRAPSPGCRKAGARSAGASSQTLAEAMGFSLSKPWRIAAREGPPGGAVRDGENELNFAFVGERSRWEYRGRFEGLVPNLERRYRETTSRETRGGDRALHVDAAVPDVRRQAPAPRGARGARRRIATIDEVVRLPVKDALVWFAALALTAREQTIAAKILKEIADRLGFLAAVGLDYLTLDRTSGTLSGGEAPAHPPRHPDRLQADGRALRPRRADRSACTSATTASCSTRCRRLRDLGNTVLVVEHDEETMRAADWIVDLGPGAGVHGGEVVAQGTPAEIIAAPRSLTGRYLAGRADHRRSRPSGGAAAASSSSSRGAARAQPEGDRRRVPARHVHLRDRRLRLGQDARSSTRSSTRRCAAVALPRRASARGPRQDRGDRASSTRSSTSTSPRSAAPRAPTPPPTPRCSTRSASSSR